MAGCRLLKKLAVLLAVLLVVGPAGAQQPPSKKKAPATEKRVLAPSKLTGQVFIVTRGRDNVKLALVDIVLIEERLILQHIKEKSESGSAKKQALLPNFTKIKEDYGAAKNLHEIATKERRPFKETQELFKDVLANARKYDEAKAEINRYDSPEYYFDSIPPGLVTTKTDADGRFSMSLPKGRFALAANTNRRVGSDTEQYYWLVWVETASPEISVMLSNDNLFETGCTACVQPTTSAKQ